LSDSLRAYGDTDSMSRSNYLSFSWVCFKSIWGC